MILDMADTCLLFSNQEANQEDQESICKMIYGEWGHHVKTLQQINLLKINSIEICNFPCP